MSGFLAAIWLLRGPAPSRLKLDGAQESLIEESLRRDETTGAGQLRDQPEDPDPSTDEPVEQLNAIATDGQRSEPIPEERVARPAGLEQNVISDNGSGEFRLEDYERRFARESRDPEWSSAMESRILSEISLMSGLAANLIQVDCRATRCRLELTLPAASSIRPTELIALSDDGPKFGLAEQAGLDTDLVLVTGSVPGQVVFLAYLRRPENTTRSLRSLRRT